MIRELDCVALTADLPEFGLHRGDVGAVVFVHTDGGSFEVEFVSATGETLALATLAVGQIRPADRESLLVEGDAPHAPFPSK